MIRSASFASFGDDLNWPEVACGNSGKRGDDNSVTRVLVP
jgi:hypothetical protein